MATLYDKRLIIVAGKGGVGRTTVAAALALSAARRGKRVLLAQMKSKERLSTLLGGPPVLTDVVRVRPGVSAVNIYPEAALREYGIMILHSAMIERAVLENRLSRAFIRAIPGVEDYSMIGKVWYHTGQMEHGHLKYDVVIVDGPATGHVVSLLQIPTAILEAVPEGPLTRDAHAMRDLLRDPVRTVALMVTVAEEMPVNETIDLVGRLQDKVGIAIGPIVVNQLYPPRFVAGPSSRALADLPETLGDAPPHHALAPLLLRSRIAMRRRALNDLYLDKLVAALPQQRLQLPYLFTPDFAAAEVEDLSRRLEAQLLALSP